MLVYVDDIIVTSNDDSIIFFIISQLKSEFVMKDLGDLSYFFRDREVARDHTWLYLHQYNYIVDLLDCANMVGA